MTTISYNDLLRQLDNLRRERDEAIAAIYLTAERQREACSLSFKGTNNITNACRNIVLNTPLVTENT